jgi:hypothetical protein
VEADLSDLDETNLVVALHGPEGVDAPRSLSNLETAIRVLLAEYAERGGNAVAFIETL